MSRPYHLLTSAKRGTGKSTAVPAVLTILSRHVLGQMRVLSDEVYVFAAVHECVKTQGEGGLCRLVHHPVVGVLEGDANFIEFCYRQKSERSRGK